MPEITPEGSFGAKRKYDRHTGIDLYCAEGTEVFAIESGTVTRIDQFTGEKVGSPWWNDTFYVGICGISGYVLYGEIKPNPNLKPGARVNKGDLLGTVMKVLKKDKGRPMSMLHLELYSIPIMEPIEWKLNEPRERWLLDPTTLLVKDRRLDHDADNAQDADRYFEHRKVQLFIDGWWQGGGVLPRNEYHEWGQIQYFKCIKPPNDGTIAMAIFIYPKFRGQGIYKKMIAEKGYPIITVDDCNIVSYLAKNNIKHFVVGQFMNSEEYKLISNFYGDRKANRSGLYLMNHIDEGLRMSCASDVARRAFMIHPIIQSDQDFADNYDMIRHIDGDVVALAMEYRRVANAYLSNRKIEHLDEIELSPLKDVNDMLIMDKLQNKKDFDTHHKGTHPRSAELEEYFNNWLIRLGFSFVPQPHKEYKK